MKSLNREGANSCPARIDTKPDPNQPAVAFRAQLDAQTNDARASRMHPETPTAKPLEQRSRHETETTSSNATADGTATTIVKSLSALDASQVHQVSSFVQSLWDAEQPVCGTFQSARRWAH